MRFNKLKFLGSCFVVALISCFDTDAVNISRLIHPSIQQKRERMSREEKQETATRIQERSVDDYRRDWQQSISLNYSEASSLSDESSILESTGSNFSNRVISYFSKTTTSDNIGVNKISSFIDRQLESNGNLGKLTSTIQKKLKENGTIALINRKKAEVKKIKIGSTEIDLTDKLPQILGEVVQQQKGDFGDIIEVMKNNNINYARLGQIDIKKFFEKWKLVDCGSMIDNYQNQSHILSVVGALVNEESDKKINIVNHLKEDQNKQRAKWLRQQKLDTPTDKVKLLCELGSILRQRQKRRIDSIDCEPLIKELKTVQKMSEANDVVNKAIENLKQYKTMVHFDQRVRCLAKLCDLVEAKDIEKMLTKLECNVYNSANFSAVAKLEDGSEFWKLFAKKLKCNIFVVKDGQAVTFHKYEQETLSDPEQALYDLCVMHSKKMNRYVACVKQK